MFFSRSRSQCRKAESRFRSYTPWFHLVTALLLVTLGQSCASVPKRDPVPQDLLDAAAIPGIPLARSWGDTAPPYADIFMAKSEDELKGEYPALFGREQVYLAISGGGANGAFAAGLLNGWTAAGTRPEFSMVTGISTGALIAPFAYLGPDYDHLLKKMYTSYSTKELLHKRKPITALTSDALFNTKGLAALIASYMTPEVMELIAEQHRRGRQLIIGTTDIDAGRPVVWNIGRIAASGSPNALELIRQVMLASASIPVAFTPVAIDVEVQGRPYQELHVDGGTSSQVFLYPAGIPWDKVLDKLQVVGNPRVYVIRNSRLDPQAVTVNRRLLPIADRSISSLIRTQGIGDLYRIFALAERDGLDFKLAFIPKEFDEIPEEEFDPAYMSKLYGLAFEMGKAGYEWTSSPPGFEQN